MTTLQSFTFSVRDEVDGPHRVTFVRHGPAHLTAECTCQAQTEPGGHCAHSLLLLAGETADIVSDNAIEVEVLEWWLTCMELEQAVAGIQAA